MVINTNSASSRGARFLADSTTNLQKSLARLSSGSKIVEPQDDAAGLAVATRTQALINRNSVTRANLGNAISFKQTQDGYLDKVASALDRMSELATLTQDETKNSTDRGLYNTEYVALKAYIANIASQDFNGVSLFGGGAFSVLQDDTGTVYTASSPDLDDNVYATNLATITTTILGASSLTAVKTAITGVATMRANVGADLSRLTKTSDHLAVLQDNLEASVSRIRDVDVAEESARYSRYNILVQSGTAMLAQANALPQSALRLLS